MSKKKDSIAINFKPDLPNVLCDKVAIAKREDNLFTLSMLQSLPTLTADSQNSDMLFEQLRFSMTHEHVKSFIDLLCKNADYYPQKPESKKA